LVGSPDIVNAIAITIPPTKKAEIIEIITIEKTVRIVKVLFIILIGLFLAAILKLQSPFLKEKILI